MKPETTFAQLVIADGGWQESPDTVAQFEESALFEGAPGRGSLYIVVEVAGEPEGRDELARELIETVRREYAASRGSITLALTQAVYGANNVFFNANAAQPPEARRIAGMTVAVLREDELFIALAGPSMACVQRGAELRRYPDVSPWFNSDENALANWLAARDFASPGAVPMGMRREYAPDVFRVALEPGDAIILSTRTLAHLLSNKELFDTLANRHPDEIISSLEDLAGAADLAVIVFRLAGEPRGADSISLFPEKIQVVEPEPLEDELAIPGFLPPPAELPDEISAETISPMVESAPTEIEEPITSQPEKPRVKIDLAPARSAMFKGIAGAMGLLAGIFARVNWSDFGKAIDRGISALLHGITRAIVFLLDALMPGEPRARGQRAPTSPRVQTAWQLAALVFPILLIGAGSAMWVGYRADQQRIKADQLTQLVAQANKAIEDGKTLARTDRNAARELFQRAITLTEQTKTLNPSYAPARTAFYNAQDELDKLNGVLVLFPTALATFSEANANPTRVIVRAPDVFVLDRGAHRVYRFVSGDANATPTPGDPVILKMGDRVSDRVVGELIDLTLTDAGRIVVIDRGGSFLQYDTTRATWSGRAASDGSGWRNVTLLANYTGNLYLTDPSRNQILKYAPAAEGVWSAATTYFQPGVSADLSNVVDFAIDSDVYLLRGDGSIFRYTAGKPNDLRVRDLETPLNKPVALITAPSMSGLYIADAGNQRIVYIDKVSGKFTRQYKPTSQLRDTFKAVKTLAVDEANRKFYWVSENQLYTATIPQ
ncbi:MAG: hypothetical protein HZC40_18270 [Chloroflexi bacterium]|nr:hypothetical protein [Chloroflexota bacterium]